VGTVNQLEVENTDELESDDIAPTPLRHPGRWVSAAVVLLLAAVLIRSFFVSPGFQWDVVRQYLFDPTVLKGIRITLALTAIAMAVGIALGTMLALMRSSPNPVLVGASTTYIWFFRGTPVLVQLIFWYNLAALYPRIPLGIPFGGPVVWSVSSNSLITPLMAAILGLGLNEGAYMAEIVRGGLLGVPHGQIEAAQSLGMSKRTMMWRIVLPQAMRTIIPPTSNEVIGMLKWTSLVSVIALSDLLYSTELIYARNFEPIPLLIVASIWYLIMTTILSIGQYFIERHFSRDLRSSQRSSGLIKKRFGIFGFRAEPQEEL
jgi:polar amino acid transport system permease protein